MSWRPGAEKQTLVARAALLRQLREFFYQRNILEVETPTLCTVGITDPAIEPLIVTSGESLDKPRFLQTSPEYAMKRLLAADSGAIYQISKAYRDGEAGRRHNPEFSLLEWYRPGFDHHQLMTEVAELVTSVLGEQREQRYSYKNLFQHYLDINPFTVSASELEAIAKSYIDVDFTSASKDQWLDLLMSHVIEPKLAELDLCFVYDYPVSQAALSKIVTEEGVRVGQRFELYVKGMELANGYNELTDPTEQRTRFIADNNRRTKSGQKERPLDENLLAAMQAGLPACAGVALGIDRLLMLLTGEPDIRKVLSFDWNQS